MIYPISFPINNDNYAERDVFEKLFPLSNKYDIFYSKRFIRQKESESREYEIDFIIAIPNKFVLCLEVKGGVIRYEGKENKWYQNSEVLYPSPDIQASAYAHNLIKRYTDLSKNIPIEWAICFPDCELPNRVNLPVQLKQNRIIDKTKLLWLDKTLPVIISELANEHPDKTECKYYHYDNFKAEILRDINFIQKLGTTIKQDEDKFIELTDNQIQFFNNLLENKKIVTRGPSGSGKTIIAKTVAKDFAREGKKVLFLCFNRTLANKIRYEQGIRQNDFIKVYTFHSLTKEIIELYDKGWWDSQMTKSQDFWEIELPTKFDEIITNHLDKYDVLVIDEGQDFGELWFEGIFKLVKNDGNILIFLDEMQNIFSRFKSIPSEDDFAKFKLVENCRNTKKIVKYLEGVTKSKIKCFNKSPEGNPITVKEFDTQKTEYDYIKLEIYNLVINENIKPEQILLITNTEKSNSCIKDIDKIGNIKLEFLDNKARFSEGILHYTTINIFKGLETDVLFILDTNEITKELTDITLYTEASRAKHKLYILKIIKRT